MIELTNLTQWCAAIGIIGLLGAWLLQRYVQLQPGGTAAMLELAALIRTGASAFLRREYSTLLFLVLIVSAILWAIVGHFNAIAYLTGALSSMLAGWAGMSAATHGNVRTAAAAQRSGIKQALRIAFFSGAVMGLSVAGLGLLGLGGWYLFFGAAAISDAEFIHFGEIVSGYAMGASSVALFARVAGGIFTKAADVGADLVGKLEAGIPEDDPRNPATIADNVGDNVGDVAGMGADIFESYVGAVVATIAIAAASPLLEANRAEAVALPILTITVGLVTSLGAISLRTIQSTKRPAQSDDLRGRCFHRGDVLHRARTRVPTLRHGNYARLSDHGSVLGHVVGSCRRHPHGYGDRVLHERSAGAHDCRSQRHRFSDESDSRAGRGNGVNRSAHYVDRPCHRCVLPFLWLVWDRHCRCWYARDGGRDDVRGCVRPDCR
jgi:hypothetical protein